MLNTIIQIKARLLHKHLNFVINFNWNKINFFYRSTKETVLMFMKEVLSHNEKITHGVALPIEGAHFVSRPRVKSRDRPRRSRINPSAISCGV